MQASVPLSTGDMCRISKPPNFSHQKYSTVRSAVGNKRSISRTFSNVRLKELGQKCQYVAFIGWKVELLSQTRYGTGIEIASNSNDGLVGVTEVSGNFYDPFLCPS